VYPLLTTFPDETFRGVLILADISGYTHFSRLHYTSLLHAEQIITELMESIIQSAEFPLQVGQLEGDAVLLFVEAPAGRESVAVTEAARQVQQCFSAFNLRERSLIACDAGCACQACNQIGELQLKAVLHFGTFTRREFQGTVELVGDDIALMHNLLKAPVEEREHILLTEQFQTLSGGLPGQSLHDIRELPVGDKTVPVHIYLPRIELTMVAVPNGAGPAFSGRLNQYSFGRMLLGKPRAVFNNLPKDGMNLVLYLLEGLNSAASIIRKNIMRALHRGPTDVIVRPGMLMMVEVQAGTEAGKTLVRELLEAAVSAARPPLIFNKVEGDATLLYALAENDRAILAKGLLNQARRMFSAFAFKRGQALIANPNLGRELRAIRFRAIFHAGDVAFKRIREFDELAGLGVILTHRLLQRSGATGSALWMTEPFYELVTDGKPATTSSTIISLEELGDIPVRVLSL
jgi:hypothetical protein